MHLTCKGGGIPGRLIRFDFSCLGAVITDTQFFHSGKIGCEGIKLSGYKTFIRNLKLSNTGQPVTATGLD